MSNVVKKIIKERVNLLKKDPAKIYEQIHNLIFHALYTCIIRDKIKDHRFITASKTKSYNVINTYSHIALENFTIAQLWKLFDDKNSVLNLKYIVDILKHDSFTHWYETEYEKLKVDIDYLSAWRHNFVGHRSEIGHFAPEEFDKKYSDIRNSEQNIKSFLLFFLCHLKSEIYHMEINKTMEELTMDLKNYTEFVHKTYLVTYSTEIS